MNNEDLCQLENLDDQTLLNTLQERYESAEIYTNCGLLLLSINPYCHLDIYDNNIKEMYKRSDMPKTHVYKMVEECIQGMNAAQKDYSIIISGESGSGKTECAKIILDYYCLKEEFEILKRVDFVIEALGNAKTAHNNNSSRFGKLIKIKESIQFETFLLEKSRVTHQVDGDQNFHIFYYILDGNNLSVNNDFIKYEGRLYTKHYEEIKMAFVSLDIDFEQIEKYLLGILELGNITLANINTSQGVDEVCTVFNMEKNAFVEYISYKIRKIGPDIIKSENTHEEAKILRDSLARIIYARVFDFIIGQINKKLEACAKISNNFTLNILDIFGFEDFKINGLEQFCINWCNEKIYDEFIKRSFEHQKNIFIQEEINVKNIDLDIDSLEMNKSNIDLIERKCGLVDLIAEESFLNGKFENLCNKLESFLKLKIKFGDTFEFNHFVGKVDYNTREFVDRNKEKANLLLIANAENLSNVSDTKYTKALDPLKNIVGAFKQSLNKLFTILNSTEIKYIKCIKPNLNKQGLFFDKNVVGKQLRVNGILQTIQLSKHLYPCSMFKDEFFEKYPWSFKFLLHLDSSISELGISQKVCEKNDLVKIIIQHKTEFKWSDIIFGKTKFFYNNKTLNFLEKVKSCIEIETFYKKDLFKKTIGMFIKKVYLAKLQEIEELKRIEAEKRKIKQKELKETSALKKSKKESEIKNKEDIISEEKRDSNTSDIFISEENNSVPKLTDVFSVGCVENNQNDLKKSTKECERCVELENKLKQKSKELFRLQSLEMEFDKIKNKLKKEKLKKINKTKEDDSSSSVECISPTNAIKCALQLYVEHCPFVSNHDIPRNEMVSLAHFIAYMIDLLSENTSEMEHRANEVLAFVIEEMGAVLSQIENDTSKNMFFLSNAIELCILIEENIIFTVVDENIKSLHSVISSLYRNILVDFKIKLKEYLPYAVIEHQSIKEIKVKQSIFKKIFTGPSIEDLCVFLEDCFDSMSFYYIPDNFIQNAFSFILSYVDYESFNFLLLKKTTYLSINRCTQINFNLSEITKVANRIGFSGANKLFFYTKEGIRVATAMLVGGSDRKLVEETVEKTPLNNLQINAIISLLDLNGKELYKVSKLSVHELAAAKFIKEPTGTIIGLEYVTDVDEFVFPKYLPKQALQSILNVINKTN